MWLILWVVFGAVFSIYLVKAIEGLEERAGTAEDRCGESFPVLCRLDQRGQCTPLHRVASGKYRCLDEAYLWVVACKSHVQPHGRSQHHAVLPVARRTGRVVGVQVRQDHGVDV